VSTSYYIPWNSVALSAATAKTIVELPTPANVAIVLEELLVGCDVSSAGNLVVEFGTFTTTGTGTAISAANIPKWRGDRSIDCGITAAKIADTVEPSGFSGGTLGSTLLPNLVTPTPALPFFQWPMDEQFSVPESTNFAIRLTSSVAGNTRGWVRFH
jgi:hypothetical protein